MIQIGGVYTTVCHREGIHLQKYAIEMGGVSRYFFTCIGVRGRFDSPDLHLFYLLTVVCGSFFAYNWSFFAYNVGALLLTIGAFLLTVGKCV